MLISARYDKSPIPEYGRALSPYYAKGKLVKEKALKILKVPNARLTKIYYIAPYIIWFEFSSHTSKIMINPYNLTYKTSEEFKRLRSSIKKANKKRRKRLPEGLLRELEERFRKKWRDLKKGKTLSKSNHLMPDFALVPYFDWHYGCTPTAAAMLLAYYDNKYTSYGNLVWLFFEDYDNIQSETNYHTADTQYWLKKTMNTNSQGGTRPDSIKPGIEKYTNEELGYNFSVDHAYYWWPSWAWDEIVDEITNNRWLDPTTCQYVPATSLEPTKGYWVCVQSACDLTVSSGATKMTTSQDVGYDVQGRPLSWSCDLQVKSSNNLASIDLRLGTASHATSKFDVGLDKPLPPPLPFMKFDAWFKGTDHPFDRLATDIKADNGVNMWTVLVRSTEGFTLSWNPLDLPHDYNFMLKGNGQEIDMKKQSSYSIQNSIGDVMSFNIIVTKIPKVFGLSHSPNPFSSGTSISFQLPHETHVTLTIYNMTGQKICELVNGNMSAGYHTVYWDGIDNNGRQAVNGIYFYRLATESCSITKKMVLIR